MLSMIPIYRWPHHIYMHYYCKVSLTRLVMSCHVMSGVGKTSIIDQFGRSEHEDVFNRDNGEAGEEAAAARWGILNIY